MAQCTRRTCWEIGHMHISSIVLGILIARKKTLYIKVRDSRKTWLGIFSRTWNLGEGNTKQEEIGGGEKEGKETNLGVQIKNAKQGRCSHSIPKRSRAWLGHAISSGSSSDFHLDHPNWSRQCNYRCLGVSFSTARMSKKMIRANYPWCRSIKYWEKNSIAHSFVHS